MVALACFCYLLTSTLYQDTHVGTIYIYNTLKKQMYTSLYRCGIHIYIFCIYIYVYIYIYILMLFFHRDTATCVHCPKEVFGGYFDSFILMDLEGPF